jgi:tRNA pseudouridine32 synthase/23S rRNA pseudouridine746 synthase
MFEGLPCFANHVMVTGTVVMSLSLNTEKQTMSPAVYQKTITSKDPRMLCDAFSLISGLSKTKVKKAMTKGAAWIRRPKKKKRRIRRATAPVYDGDTIWLYYDQHILEQTPPTARCLKDGIHYSIWFKPSGLMSQGSHFGDHCAITRQAESWFQPERPVYLVHRLDREVSGVIILAHQYNAASRLSRLLQNNQIKKGYQARVKGDLSRHSAHGLIDLPLDGRHAVTQYKITEYDNASDTSVVRVNIETGRRHQIRRHFDIIGFPILGDPRYGHHNSHAAGLQLVAFSVQFDCPFGGGRISVNIDPDQPDIVSIQKQAK